MDLQVKASQGKFSTCAQLNLCFVWPPTCIDLQFVDLGQAQIRTQVDASFYHLATQPK